MEEGTGRILGTAIIVLFVSVDNSAQVLTSCKFPPSFQLMNTVLVKGKAIPVTGEVAHRILRGRGSQLSRQSAHRWRWGCQPYAAAAIYPPGRFLILISVRGWVDPGAIVRLEGLGKLKKNKSTSSGLGPATFRLVAWCLNQLRYRVHHTVLVLVLFIECYLVLTGSRNSTVGVCVLCVRWGFPTGWSHVQGILPTVYRVKKLK
jgi:hypothetical protein